MLSESKRMRRARYLAGDDASSEAESPLERMWPRDPDADTPRGKRDRARTTAWTTKCNALPSAKLVASLRLGVQSTTGDHHDLQAKKAGKRAECAEGRPNKQTSGGEGKIKEGAHLCAKPRARLGF